MLQRRTENELRVLQFVTKKLPSMVAYWDADLICHYANDAYHTWFGVDPKTMVGTSLRDLLGPTLFARNEPHIAGALRGEVQTFERAILGPDGVLRHSVALYVPDVEDGVVQGFMVQVTEINKLKQLEEALHKETELRLLVQQHAQRLEALLQERSELLDVLAHEVRQPLNNAGAALQSAQSVFVESAQAGLSQRLCRAQAVLQQVRSSLDNTLAVASQLASAQLPQRLDTDVDLLLQLAIGDLTEGSRHRIQIERQTRTRTIAVDLGMMRLALRNLLSNALRHSGSEASVVIRITDLDEPLALCLDVEDSGTGFAADVLPTLFERRGGPQEAGRRHGLGLYIVRRVMELHGGQVLLLRNGQSGATVRMLLPPFEKE